MNATAPTLRRALCALLAALLAAALLTAPSTAPARADAPAGKASAQPFEPSRIIVSMGDSYSAGEGIPPFIGQKNALHIDRPLKDRVQDENWLAHRSTRSWPGRLQLPGMSDTMNDRLGTDWYFVASTGATTSDFYTGQPKPYKKMSLNDYENTLAAMQSLLEPGYEPDFDSVGLENIWSLQFGTEYMPPQMETLRQLKEQGEHVDYVTLTLGGNDLGFASIVSQVFTSNDMDALNSELDSKRKLIARDGEVMASLRRVYMDIASLVDDDTAIIVAGYPRLFAENKDRDPLVSLQLVGMMPGLRAGIKAAVGRIAVTADETAAVNAAVVEFNSAIEQLVTELRVEFNINIHFVDVAEAFKTHEAYAKKPWINPVMILNRPQDPVSMLSLQKDELGSSYSVHPNADGAAAYAACVQKKIDELEALRRFRYATDRLVADGAWYEGCVDYVSYTLGDDCLAEQVDLYDAEIAGFDPMHKKSCQLYAIGENYDSSTDEDIIYEMTIESGGATLSTYYYDEWDDDFYLLNEDYKSPRAPLFNVYAGLLKPELNDNPLKLLSNTLFDDIMDVDGNCYTFLLNEDEIAALGLDVASILHMWNADASASAASAASAGSPYSGYDMDSLLNSIITGNVDMSERAAFEPISTEAVIMSVDFNADMTLDNLRFFTVGYVRSLSDKGGLGALGFTRELYYVLSDQPTDAESLLGDPDDTDESAYDYDDLLGLLMMYGLFSD